ncbi:MAG: acyl-CoA dehydrogenase family protein [Deltaproteobacteria bacterium]|nr:acyl-CoA dehydrogenase family protein [Deltaproteobacteria bacterium]
MDFSLTPAQLELQNAAIDFARGELNDALRERDAASQFSREGWRKCAEFGVHALPVPTAHGGQGADLTTTIAVMEGIGYGSTDAGLLFSINASLWTNTIPLLQFGSGEQKARFLPKLTRGDWIGANLGSEPEAGSDIFGLRTRAVRDGDAYVLAGAKTWATNAPVADLFVVYATLDPALGLMGITAFLLEKGTPGLRIGGELHKMGLRTSPMAEVFLDDVRVPVTNRLGREGRGAAVFNCAMDWERGCILATCLGAMRRQLERCIDYAKTRRQFGKAIAEFQSVTNRIADMKTRLDAARLLVYRIGFLKDRGLPSEAEAAQAKLFTSEAFVQNSLDAMRTLGAYGYMQEAELERETRDAIGSLFSSGTSDIQRNIIAKKLGLNP